jgi:hypothetical protein
MGRPLNKKFFGNRNVGTAVTTDNGLGGNQVASVTLVTLSTYTTRPTATFSAPDKTALGGVTATGTVTSEAVTAVVTTAGTAYTVGDLLTLTSAGGSAIAFVATITGGGATGPVGTVNFTGTGATRGSFEALPGAKFATGATAPNTVGGTGTGAELTVTFRAKAVVITNAGSGYTDATDAAVAFTESVTGTTVLGTNTTSGNNENAINMTAFLTGGSAGAVDIIRQVSGRRYKVTDGTRTGIVTLKASVATAAGEGSIRLVDSDANTYFATKLTAHKATITRGTGVQAAFVTGSAVQWNMTAATATSLLIDNA